MMPSHDPTYPLFPVFAFLGFLVSLIPLSWHVQAWNAGTCAFMIWTAMTCLIEFVNALVWSGNVNNVAPVWCDISSKLILGASIGIPASTLCISRRLYKITAVQTVSVTREDKRRMVIGDLCIAGGIPVLIMILHVVVQPHRFDILEDIGCYPAVYNTLPAYFLYFMWPVVLGMVSFVYSFFTLRSFWLRRAQFSQLMASNTSMNRSRYLRLMLLALIDMTLTIPLTIYSTYAANKGVGLAPWISWSDTHFNFGRVALVPALFWRGNPSFQTSAELTRWLPVFCAFLFFALFGFASEAKKHYASAFWWTAQRFGFKAPVKNGLKTSLPRWKKAPSSHATPHQIYTPNSAFRKEPLGTSSLPPSLATGDTELDTYTEVDIEKSAGFDSPSSSTAPPEYTYIRHDYVSAAESGRCRPPSPQSSRARIESKASDTSLRTAASLDRIYIPDSYPASSPPRTRTPSPAPFSDVVVAPYHRPFTPPSVYPLSSPHRDAQGLNAIHVMVQTHSESTEAL